MASESPAKPVSYGSVRALLPLLDHLEEAGFDVGEVLRRAGVPREALEDLQTRLPKGHFEALWNAAMDVTGDPVIALRVGTRVTPGTLGIIGYLAAASDSPRTAFELVKDLTPLLWEDFECELESDDHEAVIRFGSDHDPHASRFTTEYAIGLTVAMSRVIGRPRSEPTEARFRCPPPERAADYERILGLPVRFDAGEDGVAFPLSMMDGVNPAADAALRQVLERHAADQLARLPTHTGLPERVRACIVSMLPLGNPTAERVAGQLGMSNRTLRRRLHDEGAPFKQILDDVRTELARHYLAKEKRTIDEVAYLVGFSDPSAFTKAFRRWTGQTPASFARSDQG